MLCERQLAHRSLPPSYPEKLVDLKPCASTRLHIELTVIAVWILPSQRVGISAHLQSRLNFSKRRFFFATMKLPRAKRDARTGSGVWRETDIRCIRGSKGARQPTQRHNRVSCEVAHTHRSQLALINLLKILFGFNPNGDFA